MRLWRGARQCPIDAADRFGGVAGRDHAAGCRFGEVVRLDHAAVRRPGEVTLTSCDAEPCHDEVTPLSQGAEPCFGDAKHVLAPPAVTFRLIQNLLVTGAAGDASFHAWHVALLMRTASWRAPTSCRTR